MLLLVLTSYRYLCVQGPCLWTWHNFFLSPKAIPRFQPFSVVRPTLVFVFSKKKVITKGIIAKHCQFTLQYSQCFAIFFSLFTFEFNHVLSFPGSTCYYAEVLDLLVRDFFFFLAFFFRPTDRQTQNQGTHSTVNKKK